MKIIKNAMTTPIEITCPECMSVLEYTYQDIKRVDETSLFGLYTTGVRRYVICPVCKKDIDIGRIAKLQEAEKEKES